MKSSPSQPTTASVEPLDIGLVAAARIGSWSVEIDQTVSGDERWFAQIEGPVAYLYLELPTPAAIEEPSRLFAERLAHQDASGALQGLSVELGLFARRPVSILFDDEFADRCFLLISDESGSTVRVSIAAQDFADVANAIQQVHKELHRDGWIGEP